MGTVQDVIDSARYDLDDFGAQAFDDTQLLNYFNRMVRMTDDLMIKLDSDYTLKSITATLATGNNRMDAPSELDKARWVYHQTEPWVKEELDKVMYRYQLNKGTFLTSAVTGISANVITDSTLANETDQYADKYLKFSSGTLLDLSYKIVSNTATTFTLDTDVEALGAAVGDIYTIPSQGKPKYWAHQSKYIFFNQDADVDYYLTFYYHKKTGTLTLTSDTPYNGDFDEFLREALISMARKAREKSIVPTDQQFYTMFKNMVERSVVGRGLHRKPYYIDY